MSSGVILPFASDLFFSFNEEKAKFNSLNYFTDFATSHFKKGRYQNYSPRVTPSLHSCLNYFYSLAIAQTPNSKNTDKTLYI